MRRKRRERRPSRGVSPPQAQTLMEKQKQEFFPTALNHILGENLLVLGNRGYCFLVLVGKPPYRARAPATPVLWTDKAAWVA